VSVQHHVTTYNTPQSAVYRTLSHFCQLTATSDKLITHLSTVGLIISLP